MRVAYRDLCAFVVHVLDDLRHHPLPSLWLLAAASIVKVVVTNKEGRNCNIQVDIGCGFLQFLPYFRSFRTNFALVRSSCPDSKENKLVIKVIESYMAQVALANRETDPIYTVRRRIRP